MGTDPLHTHTAAKFSQAGEAVLGPSRWQQGHVSLQGPAQNWSWPPGLWAYKAGTLPTKPYPLPLDGVFQSNLTPLEVGLFTIIQHRTQLRAG